MTKRTCRTHSPGFKAKVALAAIEGEKTLAEAAARYPIFANVFSSTSPRRQALVVTRRETRIVQMKARHVPGFRWWERRMGRPLRTGNIPMSSTTKTISNAQLQVLTAGAERPNRLLLPLPASMPLRGGARRALLAALLKLRFVEEVQAEEAHNAWRTDETGKAIGLRLTAAGLAAVGVPAEAPASQATDLGKAVAVDPQIDATATVEDDTGEVRNGGAADAGGGTTPPRRPTGKLGAALQAISAETGATLTELTTLTNWLPHTTRAAVTGLRQRGFPIALIQEDGRKAYRLTAVG